MDGRTFTTNNQPSAIGEGFDLTSSYIERSYLSCDQDGNPGKFDLCWRGEKLTLVLNGVANELVHASGDSFRLKQDDGSKISRLTTGSSATNGDNNGEHWKLITPDGMQYVFGQNRLPGWSAGAPETNSTWTVPVYSNDAADPDQADVCRDGDNFASSVCQQAWRWNLDLVVDRSDNSASYWYAAERNNYARNGNETNSTSYDRQGYLTRIDYGLRGDALFAGNALTKAPFSVVLGYAERCLAADCETLNSTTQGRWPDVPFKSICTDATCTDDLAPTFFTRKLLKTVTTRHAIAGGHQDIARWTFDHVWLDPGDTGRRTDMILWPTKIQLQGLAGTPAITNRPIKLLPSTDASMRNRVDATGDGIAPLIRPRLSRIISETGALTDIGYSAPDCTPSNLPNNDATNNRRCFPVWWIPNGGDDRIKDWFHKYVVEGVAVTDTTTGQSLATEYEYVGNPAWRYSQDHLTPNQYRTWSQWRGYRRVDTLTGQHDAALRSLTSAIYFRGMHGDRDADGSPKTVDIIGVHADPVRDRDEYAGMLRESILYNGRLANGSNGNEVSATVHTLTTVATNAVQTHPGGPIEGDPSSAVEVASSLVRNQATEEFTYVADPDGSAPYFRSKVSRVAEFDEHGYPSRTDSYLRPNAAGSATSDRTCSITTYARRPAANLLSLPAREWKLASSCAAADDSTLPTNAQATGPVISDVVYRYDGAASWTGQTPTRGLVTWTGRANGYTNRDPSVEKVASYTHDALGRVTSTSNALNQTTSTTYVPAGAGVPETVTSTNALGHQTTTTLDPAFGVDTKTRNPNARITEKTYDAFGRVTAVWEPNVSRDLGDPATYKFAYHLGGAELPESRVDGSWVATSSPKGNDPDEYVTSYEIFDSLLRSRQTQKPSPTGATAAGGRLLTDVTFDHRGLVRFSTSHIWDDQSPPNGTRVAAAGGGAIQQWADYDGAGRPVEQRNTWTAPTQDANGLTTRTRTTTLAYHGNAVTTSPPAGDLATRVYTDGFGRVSKNVTFPQNVASGANNLTTTFAYDPRQRLQTMTGDDQTVTSYAYDLHGRQVTTNDPDRGITTSTYDELDRLKTSVDAEQRTLTYAYDVLGRKTALYGAATLPAPAPSASNQLAAWTYDTVTKGLGLPATSTRYVGGNGAPGLAYTKSVTRYDTLSRPTRTTLTLPGSDPLVNEPPQTNARVAATLQFETFFNRDGTVASTVEPAVPGLSVEATTIGYDATGLGLPTTLSGATGIVQNTSYTPWGEVGLRTLGLSPANPNRAWINYEYDGLRRLKRTFTTELDAPNHLLDVTYTYGAGDMESRITALRDTSLAQPDNQCFTYGNYSRLEHAWTPKSPSGSADPCAVAGRTVANLGGSAPYWHSFTYNEIGTRATSTVQPTATTGAPSVTSYSYGQTCTNPDGTTPPVRPHALTSTLTTKTGVANDPDAYCVNRVGDTTKGVSPSDATRKTTYDAEGNLATLEQGTTKYTHIYDADGELLIRRPTAASAGVTTLYLGTTEVKVTKTPATSGFTYTAESYRYYDHAGARVGVRVGKPGLAHKLYYLAADHHGTASVQWDAANPLTTRNKQYSDPFGGARARVTALPGTAAAIQGDKRFLGKPHDDTTGLTHIGAREYDPALGRFLSVDPLLDTANPQSHNGYTYADNNPVNLSDPTGLDPNVALNPCKCYPPGHDGDGYAPQNNSASSSSGSSGSSGSTGGSSATAAPEAPALAQPPVRCDSSGLRCGTVAGPMPSQPRVDLGGIVREGSLAACSWVPVVGAGCDANDVRRSISEDGLISASTLFAMIGIAPAGDLLKLPKQAERIGDAANGGAGAVRRGQVGEKAVQTAYQIGDKTPFNVLGRDRIADGMTRTTVSEVKNVGYQAYTQQLKDYVTFSIDTGRRFDLYVRGGANPTRLSSQLHEAVGLGQITLRYIP